MGFNALTDTSFISLLLPEKIIIRYNSAFTFSESERDDAMAKVKILLQGLTSLPDGIQFNVHIGQWQRSKKEIRFRKLYINLVVIQKTC